MRHLRILLKNHNRNVDNDKSVAAEVLRIVVFTLQTDFLKPIRIGKFDTIEKILTKMVFNNEKYVSDVMLDLVFTNIICVLTRDNTPLVVEDAGYHPAFILSVTIWVYVRCSLAYIYINFKETKADFVGLYSVFMDSNWSSLENITDDIVVLELFYDKIYEIYDFFSNCWK